MGLLRLQRLAFLTITAVLLPASFADAAISVSIDMNTSQAGIQNERFVRPGEVFDVGVVISLSDASTLSFYDFAVRLDDSELDLDAGSIVENRPTDFSSLRSGPNVSSGSGEVLLGPGAFVQIDGFEGFNATGSIAAGDFTVGTFSLTASNAITDGFLDIVGGSFNVGTNGFLDGNSQDVGSQVSFFGGTVTAVPEPATWMVLGAISTGIVAVRARRHRGRASSNSTVVNQ